MTLITTCLVPKFSDIPTAPHSVLYSQFKNGLVTFEKRRYLISPSHFYFGNSSVYRQFVDNKPYQIWFKNLSHSRQDSDIPLQF